MDGSRFDELARTLANGRSRRSFVRSMLGVTAGAGVAAIAFSDADAASRCRTDGVACSKNADCCGGACFGPDRHGRRVCGSCSQGMTYCAPDGCVDLQYDPQHCGACGNVASTDRAQDCCNGVVVQLGTTQNCRYCGDDCSTEGDLHCGMTDIGFECVPTGICYFTRTHTFSGTITTSLTNGGVYTITSSCT